MYKIRVILDTEKDVIRTILVDDQLNLEELHLIIAKSFGFRGKEMASFYKTDKKWNQGEEIPLCNVEEIGKSISMEKYVLEETLPAKNDKLIYVYDFLSMWIFYVEVIKISKNSKDNLPQIILAVGKIPSKLLKTQFIAKTTDFNFENENNIDEELDNFDEFDYTEY